MLGKFILEIWFLMQDLPLGKLNDLKMSMAKTNSILLQQIGRFSL